MLNLKPEALRLFAAMQNAHLDAGNELLGLAIVQFVKRHEQGDTLRMATLAGETPAELISFLHGHNPAGDDTEFNATVERLRNEQA